MTEIRNKTGGRPAKKRIDKQKRVVSTKLTELQYYAIKKRAGESGLPISEYVRQAVVSAEVTPRLTQAGRRHYPQIGRRSQQPQPACTLCQCRRVCARGSGACETEKQDY